MSSERDFVTRNHATSGQAGHPHPPERETRAGPHTVSTAQTTLLDVEHGRNRRNLDRERQQMVDAWARVSRNVVQ